MKTLLPFLFTILSIAVIAQPFSQLQKLVPEDRTVNDEFGNAVAISGDYAIVGTMRDDENASGLDPLADAGSAYIFKREGGMWTQEAKIVAADREANDFFGHSVDIDGSYCIVGAHQEGVPASSGAAYVYERQSNGDWVQVNKLEAPIRKANDYFGFSVAISGDYAVVGAYFEDEDALEENEVLSAGSAYIFKRNPASGSWDFYQKIVAADRELDDRFGRSVAISGDHIVVGAEYEDPAVGKVLVPNGGSAYAFRLSDADIWEQEAKLIADDVNFSDHFGWSCAVDGDYVVVGAYEQDFDADDLNESPGAGAAYVFERGGGSWPQVSKLVASDRANIDFFGYSVDVSGNYALIGAYRQNFAGDGSVMYSDAGAAYVFERNEVNGWIEIQKINHEDRFTLDQFGFAVGMDGDDIIVGALLEDEDENIDNPLPDAGSVYIFGMSETGIAESEFRVQCFPNPTSDVITITSDHIGRLSVEVIDNLGRLIDTVVLNQQAQELSLGNLPSGVYLLRIKSNSGTAQTMRVVRR